MSQPRILVVDDEVTIRIAFRLVLRSKGFDVIEAGRGAEALEICAGEPPDLVLLDLLMPDLTGRDVLRQLDPAFKARVPIIVVSASDDPKRQAEVFALGAVAFIVKPFRNATMTAAVEHFLHSRGAPVDYIPDLRLPDA